MPTSTLLQIVVIEVVIEICTPHRPAGDSAASGAVSARDAEAIAAARSSPQRTQPSRRRPHTLTVEEVLMRELLLQQIVTGHVRARKLLTAAQHNTTQKRNATRPPSAPPTQRQAHALRACKCACTCLVVVVVEVTGYGAQYDAQSAPQRRRCSDATRDKP